MNANRIVNMLTRLYRPKPGDKYGAIKRIGITLLGLVAVFIYQYFDSSSSHRSSSAYTSSHQSSSSTSTISSNDAFLQHQLSDAQLMTVSPTYTNTEQLIKLGAQPCKVIDVHDGDTIKCTANSGKIFKIRLYGIDTPEVKQDYGKEATRALASLIDGKQIYVGVHDIDIYKRVLGIIFYNGQNLNYYMVNTGNAFVYKQAAKRSPLMNLYRAAQKHAQDAKLGLWNPSFYKNGKGPVDPYNYRHSK